MKRTVTYDMTYRPDIDCFQGLKFPTKHKKLALYKIHNSKAIDDLATIEVRLDMMGCSGASSLWYRIESYNIGKPLPSGNKPYDWDIYDTLPMQCRLSATCKDLKYDFDCNGVTLEFELFD